MRVVFSLGILAFFLLVAIALNHTGGSARTGPATNRTFIINQPVEAYELMRDTGYHGRVAVLMTDAIYLRQESMEALFPSPQSLPLDALNISEEANRLANNDNFIWSAIENNLIRKAVFALPERFFETIKPSAIGQPMIKVYDDRIEDHYYTAPITLTKENALKPMDEPVIFFVDASFFRTVRAEDAAEHFRANIRPLIIIACTLEGEDFVSENEREKMMTFLSMIGGDG